MGVTDPAPPDSGGRRAAAFPLSSTPPLEDLWRHASTQRPKVVFATIMSVLNKACDIMPELLIGVAVDVVVNEGESFIGRSPASRTASTSCSCWRRSPWWSGSPSRRTQYVAHLTWRNLAQTIEHDTRMEVYGHVQSLEMSYFEDTTSGGMMTVLNDDVNQLERFLDVGADEIIVTIANVVFVGIVFAVISPTLAVLAFLPIPVIVVGSLRYQRRLQPRYDAVREAATAHRRHAQQQPRRRRPRSRPTAARSARSTVWRSTASTTARSTARRSACRARSSR